MSEYSESNWIIQFGRLAHHQVCFTRLCTPYGNRTRINRVKVYYPNPFRRTEQMRSSSSELLFFIVGKNRLELLFSTITLIVRIRHVGYLPKCCGSESRTRVAELMRLGWNHLQSIPQYLSWFTESNRASPDYKSGASPAMLNQLLQRWTESNNRSGFWRPVLYHWTTPLYNKKPQLFSRGLWIFLWTHNYIQKPRTRSIVFSPLPPFTAHHMVFIFVLIVICGTNIQINLHPPN